MVNNSTIDWLVEHVPELRQFSGSAEDFSSIKGKRNIRKNLNDYLGARQQQGADVYVMVQSSGQSSSVDLLLDSAMAYNTSIGPIDKNIMPGSDRMTYMTYDIGSALSKIPRNVYGILHFDLNRGKIQDIDSISTGQQYHWSGSRFVESGMAKSTQVGV